MEEREAKVRRWLKSARWLRLRAAQLKAHPHCQCPHHHGREVRADDPRFGGPVVDHRVRHHGDERLFWNPQNLQSMTKQCHDRYKQSQEAGGAGFLVGADSDGLPLDPSHPFYR